MAMAAILAAVYVLRYLLSPSGRRKSLNLPPGPRGWPVIGSLGALAGALQPHRVLAALAARHGPLMHLRLGSYHTVVASSVDTARLVLKTHDLAFADRPRTAAGEVTSYGYLGIVHTPCGAYWRMARKLCATELFSARRVDSFRRVREQEMRALVRGLQAEDEAVARSSRPLLREHPRRARGTAAAGSSSRRRICATDLVDVLLQLAEDTQTQESEASLPRDGVKAFIQDIIAGGTERSAVTIEWAISELLRHPEAMAAATDELDRVVGSGRWVAEHDLPELPYIDAVVKETLRLHPVGPLLVPHHARQDTVVAGYDVPAGAPVLVNAWAIARDQASWPDAPDTFRPDWFLGASVDVRGAHFELLPFGSGRRICPAYDLAMKPVAGGVANLVHGFAWRLPDGVAPEDVSMEDHVGLSTRRKVPLVAVAEPRLLAHLYAATE
ncbi:unnamed protein product [Miscanthus lutarioriparius]|uniref:Cytochrome P450 n=1 Tax=Miscanthus lutarioriparius TaxID=422564 RepID=A0A811NF05_9POAL|nr:unnamed protein product [Miscanthus lutarioriparius]